MIEKQAIEWACIACSKNCGHSELCDFLDVFIGYGKEKGYIEQLHIEKARLAVKACKEKGFKLHPESPAFNDIINEYEAHIKELEEKNEN